VPSFSLLAQLGSIVHESITGSLLRSETGKKSLFEGVDGGIVEIEELLRNMLTSAFSMMIKESCSVEELVLQHYAQAGGWSGVHCEGGLWRALAVLLLWEMVYDSAVPFV